MSWKVCATPGCATLVDRDNPCPEHGRPVNARWSRDRDGAEHNRWARRTKARDGYRCTHCGATEDLQAHHTGPSEGVTLCRACHKAADPHAR